MVATHGGVGGFVDSFFGRVILLTVLLLAALGYSRPVDAQSPPYSYTCSYNDGSWQSCPPTYASAPLALAACQAVYNYYLGIGWHHYAAYTWSCGTSNSPVPSANRTCYYMSLMDATNSIGTEGYFCGFIEPEGATPEQCEALAQDANYTGAVARTYSYAASGSATRPIGGCCFGPRMGQGFGSVKHTYDGMTYENTMWGFSGAVCAGTPPIAPLSDASVPNTPPKLCKPAGDGQTFCVKSDGQYCATASSGRDICWSPGETGVKRDGNTAQTNVPGTSPAPPTIPGETPTDAAGPPITVTHTSGGTTTTTTINNYTTTTAAPTNQGEATTADSAAGGTCSSSYICSGDTLKCAMLEEARKTRCAVEHANEGVSGGATCAVGDVPVCVGAACNASAYAAVLQQHKTRCLTADLAAKADTTNAKLGEIKTAIEGISGGSVGGVATELSGEVALPGDDDAAQGAEGTAAGNDHGEETEYGEDGLNDEGMGFDRSCPALVFEFNGATYTPDMFWVCTAAEIESVIMLLIVAFLCLRYIGSA